jgi:hypothetical protein
MCLKSPDGPSSAEDTFRRLESHLSSLKGRKFYGLSKLENGNLTYLACVNMEKDDDGDINGGQIIILEKGTYVREKISDWKKNLEQIPAVIDRVAAESTVNSERYVIEFYRSERELFLLIPIK